MVATSAASSRAGAVGPLPPPTCARTSRTRGPLCASVAPLRLGRSVSTMCVDLRHDTPPINYHPLKNNTKQNGTVSPGGALCCSLLSSQRREHGPSLRSFHLPTAPRRTILFPCSHPTHDEQPHAPVSFFPRGGGAAMPSPLGHRHPQAGCSPSSRSSTTLCRFASR